MADGRALGVVANQPRTLVAVLDIRASEKGPRFVRLRDAFGLPLITLVDTPGLLPGRDQEYGGVIPQRCQTAVRLLRGDGAASDGDPAQGVWRGIHRDELPIAGADAVFSWPGAEIAVMGAEGAVDVICRRDLQANPTRGAEFIERYRNEAMVPHISAERLSVDETITLDRTRQVIASMLRSLNGANRPRFRHDKPAAMKGFAHACLHRSGRAVHRCRGTSRHQ